MATIYRIKGVISSEGLQLSCIPIECKESNRFYIIERERLSNRHIKKEELGLIKNFYVEQKIECCYYAFCLNENKESLKQKVKDTCLNHFMDKYKTAINIYSAIKQQLD